MHYSRISADCHIDLPWIPPDLFTANASAAMKDRMPHVTDGPDGPYWTCKNGGSLGLMWGSDYPHGDGVWPESSTYIEEQFGHLPPEITRKIVCENAGRFYGLIA